LSAVWLLLLLLGTLAALYQRRHTPVSFGGGRTELELQRWLLLLAKVVAVVVIVIMRGGLVVDTLYALDRLGSAEAVQE